MTMQTLHDAFVDELRDILHAEKQLAKALPKMAKAAQCEDLRAGLEQHLTETKTHIERLDQVFQSLGITARAKKCEAMEGLLKEGASLLEEKADDDVKDALIIAAAQKVEHYEIATYGTLCTWAKILGHETALDLLKQTMNDEETTDKKLTDLAIEINQRAMAPA